MYSLPLLTCYMLHLVLFALLLYFGALGHMSFYVDTLCLYVRFQRYRVIN